MVKQTIIKHILKIDFKCYFDDITDNSTLERFICVIYYEHSFIISINHTFSANLFHVGDSETSLYVLNSCWIISRHLIVKKKKGLFFRRDRNWILNVCWNIFSVFDLCFSLCVYLIFVSVPAIDSSPQRSWTRVLPHLWVYIYFQRLELSWKTVSQF